MVRKPLFKLLSLTLPPSCTKITQTNKGGFTGKLAMVLRAPTVISSSRSSSRLFKCSCLLAFFPDFIAGNQKSCYLFQKADLLFLFYSNYDFPSIYSSNLHFHSGDLKPQAVKQHIFGGLLQLKIKSGRHFVKCRRCTPQTAAISSVPEYGLMMGVNMP